MTFYSTRIGGDVTKPYKMLISAVLIAILVCSLVGCSPKITSGEVIGKQFTPEHTTLQFVPLVMSNGKTTTTTMIPVYYHYSDRWEITISGLNEDGELVKETFRVEKAVYDAVSIGAEFEYDKDMNPEEPEYIRERADR